MSERGLPETRVPRFEELYTSLFFTEVAVKYSRLDKLRMCEVIAEQVYSRGRVQVTEWPVMCERLRDAHGIDVTPNALKAWLRQAVVSFKTALTYLWEAPVEATAYAKRMLELLPYFKRSTTCEKLRAVYKEANASLPPPPGVDGWSTWIQGPYFGARVCGDLSRLDQVRVLETLVCKRFHQEAFTPFRASNIVRALKRRCRITITLEQLNTVIIELLTHTPVLPPTAGSAEYAYAHRVRQLLGLITGTPLLADAPADRGSPPADEPHLSPPMSESPAPAPSRKRKRERDPAAAVDVATMDLVAHLAELSKQYSSILRKNESSLDPDLRERCGRVAKKMRTLVHLAATATVFEDS